MDGGDRPQPVYVPVKLLAPSHMPPHPRRQVRHCRAGIEIKALSEKEPARPTDIEGTVFRKAEDEDIAPSVPCLFLDVWPRDVEECHMVGEGKIGHPTDGNRDDSHGPAHGMKRAERGMPKGRKRSVMAAESLFEAKSLCTHLSFSPRRVRPGKAMRRTPSPLRRAQGVSFVLFILSAPSRRVNREKGPRSLPRPFGGFLKSQEDARFARLFSGPLGRRSVSFIGISEKTGPRSMA